MAQTVGDFFWQRLFDWGVRRVFGYPGDGVNGLLGALQRRNGDIEFIQARHEEMAAFMATAHAKFTGELGVCIATSGPGASHLITGLYDGKLDHVPVLAIAGQQARTAIGAHYQQELDLTAMFRDVAGDYVQQAIVPAQVRHLTDRAVRIALSRRAVTALIFPNDLQEMPYSEPKRQHGSVFSGSGWNRPSVKPQPGDLERAANLLNTGDKVAMLVGAGALGAVAEVEAVAERLGAGVAKALLGKAVLPDDLPFVTGSIGLLGTLASWEMMQHCDTLLMIGTGFPYSEFLPEPGRARAVQIDLDPAMLSLRYPAEVALTGDAKETLQALLPLLTKRDRSFRQAVKGWIDKSREQIARRAAEPATPINPQRVFTELSPRLPEQAIITSDSGSCANWYARDLVIRRGMMASLSGGLASMGAAVPYAIAAKLAYPHRPVIALVGDGAMQMNNMAELITVAKYWKQWGNPTWICMVLNNTDLNQVTWEQRVMEGNPKFEATQNIPDVPYHAFAKLIGLRGIYVDDPDQLGPSWEDALAATVPTVLEVRTDPDVPPLPPHITLEQAKNFMFALPDDVDRDGVLARTAGQVLGAVLPHRSS